MLVELSVIRIRIYGKFLPKFSSNSWQNLSDILAKIYLQFLAKFIANSLQNALIIPSNFCQTLLVIVAKNLPVILIKIYRLFLSFLTKFLLKFTSNTCQNKSVIFVKICHQFLSKFTCNSTQSSCQN